MLYTINKEAKRVLDFWFNKNSETKWFSQDVVFDGEIKNKFLATYNRACEGEYDDWADIPEELLALIIILDQFPRNMFRNSPKMYETDEEALALTKHAIYYRMDSKLLTIKERRFLYMPLMHSEKLEDQELSLKYFTPDREAYPYAQHHREIIARFKRFPHRNKILGRKSNNEETLFLKTSLTNI